jgi:virginiamycin B lyase
MLDPATHTPPMRSRSFSFTSRRALVLAFVLSVLAATLAALLWPGLGPRGTKIVEYPMSVPSDIPTAVAVAPDGSVWFSIDSSDAVGVVRAGKLERIVKGSRSVEPIGIAVDTKGKVWVTDAAAVSIVAVSATGEVQSVKLGTPIARLGRMAAAPDESIWFAESTAYSITRLKDGQLTRHPIDSVRGGPYGVAVSADGAVWATLQSSNSLLRIGPDGQTTEHQIPTPGVSPTDVAVDGSGAVWFLEFRTDRIGRFHNGKFEELAVPEEKAGLTGLAVAPDGAVWFGMLRKGSIGRLRDGKFAQVKLPRERARPYSVAVDQSGNVWYADIAGYVGMLPATEAAR